MVHIYVTEIEPTPAISKTFIASSLRQSFLNIPRPTSTSSRVPSDKSNSRRADFANVLRPILTPLSLVGIQPKMDLFRSPRPGPSIRWWNVLALLYLHVITVKDFASVVLTPGGQDFWVQITTLLRSGAATVSADVYVMRQARLRLLFRKVSVQYGKFCVAERKAFRGRIRLGSFGVLAFLASYYGISAATAYDMGVESFLNVYLFSARISGVSSTVQFAVCCVFMLVRHLIMWGTVAFLIVLYVALCDAVKMSFRSFNQTLAYTLDQRVHPVDLLCLHALRQQFENLANILCLMDDVFSPIIFFWYSSFLLSVCIEITFDISLYSRVENYPLLRSILKLFVLFIAYALIGICASLAVEESQKGIFIFNRVSSQHPPPRGIHVSQAYQMLGSHLTSARLALTGWKFFNLNRSYMLTIVGIFASYVIIVVQLNPQFMTKIITG